MKAKPCTFFASGKCTRGDACTYSHEHASSTLRPEATSFQPTQQPNTLFRPKVSVPPPRQHGVPCHFYNRGFCKRGDDCAYDHSVTTALPPGKQTRSFISKSSLVPDCKNAVERTPEAEPISVTTAHPPNSKNLESRRLGGAVVGFGPGAEIDNLEFPSDYSSVQISCTQADCNAQKIQDMLESLDEAVPLSCIRTRAGLNNAPFIAQVKVKDPRFGQRIKVKISEGLEKHQISGLVVNVIQVGNQINLSANRLQLSSVSCTWYKPSRMAWLHYTNLGKAKAAEAFIVKKDLRIAGCKIMATLQIPEHHFRHRATVFSVQLRNLDAIITRSTIEQHIPKHLKPQDVVMGKVSYLASTQQAGELVKSLLEEIGPLEAWEVSDTVSATQVKATARFQVAEDARRAVGAIDGRKLSSLGNSPLFVSPSISVKFNVLRDIYNAILVDLERFKLQMWSFGHVHVKVYMPTSPSQKLIAIRIYGDDAKNVAKVKGRFEEILTGDTATNGDAKIWDGFFATPAGLAYLNELGQSNQGYIYRDIRKHRLSLFGSVESKEQIEKALIEKAHDLLRTTHYIPLTTEDFKKALEGGFRRITAALGKQNVTLDIRPQPKLITIVGSHHDLETARSLLSEDVPIEIKKMSLADLADESDCAVCWTEAEDPYRCPCGHVYCRSCFSSQCSSAGEGDLPVRCLGDAGKCQQVFALEELRAALPSAAFEHLLEDSFATHIRTNPGAFQYCPTPDCQQIYRVSADGVIFTCPDCLTPICTACQITSHDGLSCAVYKSAAVEGNEEFQTWKRANDVKDCPGCKAPIEKSDGCNHMECRNCKTHICWVCLETFDASKECYGHMQRAHGSFM